jgi:hypothetical protein
MSSKLSDGLFIAIDRNGEVCTGANSSGVKLYVYESVAIKKAGLGGKVYRVDEKTVSLIWPVAKTFFLNEQHELPRRKKDEECSACGSTSCYGHLCYGID